MPIFELFLLGKIRQEHVFYDILEGETAFLGYKKRTLKIQKVTFFERG